LVEKARNIEGQKYGDTSKKRNEVRRRDELTVNIGGIEITPSASEITNSRINHEAKRLISLPQGGNLLGFAINTICDMRELKSSLILIAIKREETERCNRQELKTAKKLEEA
jgi:hypothetical protein